MTIPRIRPPGGPAAVDPTRLVTRAEAARRLDVNASGGLRKMIRCGLLPASPTESDVERWEGRQVLDLESGELTVLRTDAKEPSPPMYPTDPRKWLGFDITMTEAELEDASLRWWRCKPERVVNNELFAVTIAEYPVALYLLHEHVASNRYGDEKFDRHHFAGVLLARIDRNLELAVAPSSAVSESDIRSIMASRIRASSGGPIGYLEAE